MKKQCPPWSTFYQLISFIICCAWIIKSHPSWRRYSPGWIKCKWLDQVGLCIALFFFDHGSNQQLMLVSWSASGPGFNTQGWAFRTRAWCQEKDFRAVCQCCVDTVHRAWMYYIYWIPDWKWLLPWCIHWKSFWLLDHFRLLPCYTAHIRICAVASPPRMHWVLPSFLWARRMSKSHPGHTVRCTLENVSEYPQW